MEHKGKATTNLTAKELSGEHIGKRVEVIVPGYDGTPVTGTIRQICQSSSWTEIKTSYTRGVSVPHNTPITIQEGQ